MTTRYQKKNTKKPNKTARPLCFPQRGRFLGAFCFGSPDFVTLNAFHGRRDAKISLLAERFWLIDFNLVSETSSKRQSARFRASNRFFKQKSKKVLYFAPQKFEKAAPADYFDFCRSPAQPPCQTAERRLKT